MEREDQSWPIPQEAAPLQARLRLFVVLCRWQCPEVKASAILACSMPLKVQRNCFKVAPPEMKLG